MKKIVRTVWIGLLSGVAFIVACCCSQNKTPKTDDNLEKKQRVVQLQQQLDSITNNIKKPEGACVYGPPEIIQQYGEETRRLKQEAENIQNQIKELENE